MSDGDRPAPRDERRVHARLHVEADIEVWGPNGPSPARLRDLSRGGARFLAQEPAGNVGDTIHLSLPFSGVEVEVMAEIVRTSASLEGHEVAVRFAIVEPALRQALHELLDLLLASENASGRRHARLARRMALQYGTSGELKAMLTDISRGGLSMVVAEPLVIDEEIEILIPDEQAAPLAVRACVVNQRSLSKDGVKCYRVGLKFGVLGDSTGRRLESLLNLLL